MRDSRWIQDQAHIRVDRARIVWLTLGLLFSLGLTFALGFLTGRRAERIAATPPQVDVLTQIDSDEAMHDELTFYSKLTEGAETTPPKVEPQKRPSAVAGDAPATTPPEPTPAPKPNPDPDKKQEQATSQPGNIKIAKLESAVARARDTARRSEHKEVEKALASGPAQPGDFTVQVSAFQSMGEARAFSAGLERKGFKPFVVATMIPGRGTWYRVRLGRFASEQQAADAKTVLAQAAIPAWVLRVE